MDIDWLVDLLGRSYDRLNKNTAKPWKGALSSYSVSVYICLWTCYWGPKNQMFGLNDPDMMIKIIFFSNFYG